MSDAAITAIPTGSTLATAIAYANSNTALLRTAVVGNLEGRGAATPNLADKTVEQDTVAYNASVCVWSAEMGFFGVVVTGFTYSSASGLTATYTSGTAWILRTSTSPEQNRRIVASSNLTVLLTASSDNWVYLKLDGTLGVATTSVGGAQPTIPDDSLLLGVATTNGSTVTGTPVDKRLLSVSTVSKHWRSGAFWSVPTTSTNIRVPPGIVELEGILFETVANNDLDLTATANMISGTRTSNAWTYSIVANNAGSLKFGLTMSQPSATTVVSGATSGSTGRLQWRTIGGLPYRYLGAHRLIAGGGTLVGSRIINGMFMYASSTAMLSGGTATSFTSVSFATRVPPIARSIKLGFSVSGATGDAYMRENGVSGQGKRIFGDANNMNSVEFLAPCSSAQKVDYKIAGGTGADMDCYGYREELD